MQIKDTQLTFYKYSDRKKLSDLQQTFQKMKSFVYAKFYEAVMGNH